MNSVTVAIGPEFDSVLAAGQAGADWAIATLYRDLNPALLRFFGAQASGAADDLAQETWMAAAPQLGAFVGSERAFRAWLFTIARRRLIEHWRRMGRRPSMPVAPTDLIALLGSAGDDPATGLEAREAVAALVAGLPPEQVEILLLRVVAGLDAEEVGVIVGKTAGAVRVLQHRALRRLARRFGLEAPTP